MRLALLLASLATPVAAHSLPVKVQDGAAWTMTVEQSRETKRGDKVQAWTFLNTQRLSLSGDRLTVTPISIKAEAGPSQQAAAARTLSVPVIMTVDETLSPEEIVNRPQVSTAVSAMLQGAGIGADEKAAMAKASPALVDATVDALAKSDLVRAALAQGVDLELGVATPYEDRLPNPLGGPPIRSKASFTLESYDAKTGRAVISWRQQLDPGSTRESISLALNALTAKIAPERVDEARAAFAKMTVTRDDACRHEIDIPTGIAVRVECSSLMTSGVGDETGQVRDRWIITQTLPETSAKMN